MAATTHKPVDLELLRIFAAVAEHASFSKAAKALGVSKGTTSRAIARLEEIVGTELLHRDTHKVAMSTAGVALFERTVRHLTALKDAVEALPERRDTPSGLLRISSSYDFGVTMLPAIVAAFSLRFPDVTFDIQVTNAVTDLVAEGFDLSIRVAARGLSDSSLTARKLGPAELRFYGSPSYIARRGEPREYGASTHDWVVFRPSTRLFKPKDGAAVRFFSNDLLFVQGLLLADAAIGTLPPFVAEADVQAGRLSQVMPSRTLRGPGGFYFVYPARGQTSRKVAAFRDFLIGCLESKPLA
jgi:DNA-binding transcriptional LysR family regulator